jgi:hypothetical protein
MASSPPLTASIDLYWLPLGAGGHFVRLNGLVFEAFAARLERRDRCDLYHSALEVHVPDGRFVIEQAPIRPSDGAERGVVAQGPVGTRAAGRFRLFRYEIRRWRDGIIPDIDEAAPQQRSRVCAAAPRARATGADSRLGSRRAARRRDVELELADLVAHRPHRARCRIDPPAARRTSPGLAGRPRRSAAPAGLVE